MTCHRCLKKFERVENRCPHCGEPNTASGVFQTSTVLISTSSDSRVFRSVNEVPGRLRAKLVKYTTSANSATILIADRRGRREIARVMRNGPGGGQRVIQSILGKQPGVEAPEWLTGSRKRALAAVLALVVLFSMALIFTTR